MLLQKTYPDTENRGKFIWIFLFMSLVTLLTALYVYKNPRPNKDYQDYVFTIIYFSFASIMFSIGAVIITKFKRQYEEQILAKAIK